MLPQEIIRDKRDGKELTREQIAYFVHGITSGRVTEGQIAAFAMAVFFKGMKMSERVALTEEMMRSGQVLNWQDMDLNGPVVDKHSTGGVSDSVSLMLGPLVAACGGYIPMISGRGLGHTGGTLDKFESIPGYNTSPNESELKRIVKQVGVAIIGQTGEIAPADKRFYGIRDVTATVDSIPLITASILSKKLAAGLDALAMDVKTGSGAFMVQEEDARALAESIVTVANQAGVATSATITDMNEPLGSTAGNAIEMREAIDYLTGKYRHPRLHAVTMKLAEQMLVLTNLVSSEQDAMEKLNHALDSGKAAEKFSEMVRVLGGPSDLVENYETHLPLAKVSRDIFAPQAGYVHRIDTRKVGLAVVSLGGGRTDPAQQIDHSVGLSGLAGIGSQVDEKTPVARVFANSEEEANAAAEAVQAAYSIGVQPADLNPVIYSVLDPK
ncbi:MAG: thymidine phosphorylase DeoA [Idiomarinaceae bacterium HL-53]|nr:MAG: thymidine phosphorylase DeoA [Idiomarinaceae bacterium HL-53]CUS47701.1 thymidine phosphorylase [Idiomarinaceae bacterium HL-53]